MVALQLALVVVSLAVDVHQVEFVDQSLPLEQPQRAIDRAAIDAGIDFLRLAQNLAGVEVLAGSLHHAEDGASLLRHANSALGEVRLQSARHFVWGSGMLYPLSQLVANRAATIFLVVA